MAKGSATQGKKQTKAERIEWRKKKREARLAWKEKRREPKLKWLEQKEGAKLKWLEKKGARPQSMEFFLVFWMLVSLTLLVILIVFFPVFLRCFISSESELYTRTLEYSKWVLAALLAAFGAWIGAGAAYFFSKESLQESSRATEAALEIQQKSVGAKPEAKTFVKDLALTTMNPSFMFSAESEFKDVIDKLKVKLGHWFVPIINKDSGILEDIVSSQVFWQFKHGKVTGFKGEIKGETKIGVILDFLITEEAKEELKKLHGINTFFIKITLNDTIESVANRMTEFDTAVAIVVDEQGKPTHFLTRAELGTKLKTEG